MIFKRPAMTLLVSTLLLPLVAACGASSTSTTGSAATSAPAAAATMAPMATMEMATSAPAAAATMAPMATMEMATMAPAATAASGSTGSTEPVSGKLTIAGSSALLPLIQEAAKEFQAANSGAQITVTAGGSGAGRTQVCGGQIDIGNSDVNISADEQTKLNCADAVSTPVAVQAFAPVANKQGPGSVTNLTKDQLVSIFNGTVKNWKEVGGDDQGIVLINRAKGSGTRSTMAKFLFAGDDTKFATGDSEEDNSETVRQTVSQTPGAISYLSYAYLQSGDLLAIGVDGVTPNKASIQGGTWKIGGPGYAITKGAGTPIAQAFLKFVTSEAFQKGPAFDKLGFVPVAK